jgi:hypothetical protein
VGRGGIYRVESELRRRLHENVQVLMYYGVERSCIVHSGLKMLRCTILKKYKCSCTIAMSAHVMFTKG